MCSSASSGKSSPTPRVARITSRRCGAAATCCGSHQTKKQKSQPDFFLGIAKPRLSAGVFACEDPFSRMIRKSEKRFSEKIMRNQLKRNSDFHLILLRFSARHAIRRG